MTKSVIAPPQPPCSVVPDVRVSRAQLQGKGVNEYEIRVKQKIEVEFISMGRRTGCLHFCCYGCSLIAQGSFHAKSSLEITPMYAKKHRNSTWPIVFVVFPAGDLPA